MKVTLYGTAAAEGFPAMFCECDACMRARAAGGRNLRTRSEALIDSTLLIDFGPDLLTHTLYSGLSLIPVTDVIITHSHPDHLLPGNLWARDNGIGHIHDKQPLRVYCTQAAFDRLAAQKQSDRLGDDIVRLYRIEPFVPFCAGHYTVTPLQANHGAETDPVVYLINDGNSTFFYCTDTGMLPEETKDYLRHHPANADAIAIDCTAGLLENWRDHHLGLDTDKLVIDELRELQALKSDATVVLHHFSHNCQATYDDLVPIAAQYGYAIAYDGMELTV